MTRPLLCPMPRFRAAGLSPMRRIAVIGSGISGLAVAHALAAAGAASRCSRRARTSAATATRSTCGWTACATAWTPASWSSTTAPIRGWSSCSMQLGRGHRAVGDVVLGAGAAAGHRMERLRPEHRVRAAPQPAAPALPGACWRRSCASTGWPRGWPRPATRPRWPSRSATSSTRHGFGERLPRLVLAADAGLHLVLPHRPDAALPGGHDDPLLPQPRPDPGQQPAAVAHRGRRLARVRAEDAGAHPPTRGCARPCARCARTWPAA